MSEYGCKLMRRPAVFLLQNKPDAVSPWNASQEGADAANWAQGFIDIWGSPLPILTAGLYAVTLPQYPIWPNVDYLIDTAYNATVHAPVKVYSGHLYASSSATDLATEMNHVQTVTDLAVFTESITTAESLDRSFILGKRYSDIRTNCRTLTQLYGPGETNLFTLHNLRTCAGSALEAFQGAGKRTYDALLRRGMGSEPPIIAIFGLRMHRDGVHRVLQGAGRLVCTLVVFRASLVGGCCGLNERSIRRSLPPPGPFFRVKGTRHLQATCNSTQARGKFTGV